MQVARVAESVGYSHQTSFATAFRKYFGMCPKDARPPSHTECIHQVLGQTKPNIGVKAKMLDRACVM